METRSDPKLVIFLEAIAAGAFAEVRATTGCDR